MQPHVVRGHLGGVVVEDAAYNFLRDVPVDHSGAQSMTPLVRGEVGGPPVLVAEFAELEPAVEDQPVGGARGRIAAVGVLRRPGK